MPSSSSTPSDTGTITGSIAGSINGSITGSINGADAPRCEQSRFGVFPECPLCGGSLHPEHAHFKCAGCGWRDSCCD